MKRGGSVQPGAADAVYVESHVAEERTSLAGQLVEIPGMLAEIIFWPGECGGIGAYVEVIAVLDGEVLFSSCNHSPVIFFNFSKRLQPLAQANNLVELIHLSFEFCHCILRSLFETESSFVHVTALVKCCTCGQMLQ